MDEICVDSTVAVVRGRNGGWMVTREGGLTKQVDDVYLMVLFGAKPVATGRSAA